jgi:4-hydroxy-tetrahydrodipicolinate synthase
MFGGCYTAMVTPMSESSVDYDGLKSLLEFQVQSGVSGVVMVGTTGESPTLTWKEHMTVIQQALNHSTERFLVVAGTGSNSTEEALEATKRSWDFGARAALLIDPYYNGPSSVEIRKEYLEPIARTVPEMQLIPYVIPGRTGTQLMPHDLAILHRTFKNINSVKEATGDYDNARLTRRLCGDGFAILSGDDDRTYELMTMDDVKACGVVSVVSNFAPKAVHDMCKSIMTGEIEKARRLVETLKPLFQTVTVKTDETTPYGTVTCKARNPLPCKTLMRIMGMPSGLCRAPLGKMTRKGVELLVEKARTVYANNPDILQPIEEFFDVDLQKRLYNDSYWRNLCYESY